MDKVTRLALLNIATLASELEPGATISSERFFEIMARTPDVLPSDAVIRHAYRHFVVNRGIPNAERIVSYRQAAELADTSIAAIRQAAYRRRVTPLTEYFNGLERRGVTLRSLGKWRGWTQAKFQESVRLLETAEKFARLVESADNTDKLVKSAEKFVSMVESTNDTAKLIESAEKIARLAESTSDTANLMKSAEKFVKLAASDSATASLVESVHQKASLMKSAELKARLIESAQNNANLFRSERNPTSES